MKNIILLLVALSINFAVSAQKKNFPDTRPELLKGKEVTVIAPADYKLSTFKGYPNFYAKKDGSPYEKANAVVSKREALEGRTFLVESIELEPTYKTYWIQLKDVKTAEVIYYKYSDSDQKFGDYYFDVKGGIDVPADFYCDYVKTDPDGPAGLTNYIGKKDTSYKITSSRKGEDVVYYVYLEVSKDGTAPAGRGAILYLENNKTITLPKALVQKNTKLLTPSYYSTFYLEPANVELLKTNKIISYKLATVDGMLYGDQAEYFKGILNCLVTKK